MTSMPLWNSSIDFVVVLRSLKIDCRSLLFSLTTSLTRRALDEPSSKRRRMSLSDLTRVSDSSARLLLKVEN